MSEHLTKAKPARHAKSPRSSVGTSPPSCIHTAALCLHDRPSSRRLAASVTVAPLLPAPTRTCGAFILLDADAPQHPQPHRHPCSRHASTPRYPQPPSMLPPRCPLVVARSVVPVQLPAHLCHAHAMCLCIGCIAHSAHSHVALHPALRPVPVRVLFRSLLLMLCAPSPRSISLMARVVCVCRLAPLSSLSHLALAVSLHSLDR